MQSAVKESQIRSMDKLKFSKGRLKSGKNIFYVKATVKIHYYYMYIFFKFLSVMDLFHSPEV